MIYYFSATGNSKYVAERIAGALGDEARSIQGCDGRLSRSDVIGFVTPTYAWGLPDIVKRFFSALVVEQPEYAFLVATYDTTPGFTGEQARKLLAGRPPSTSRTRARSPRPTATPTRRFPRSSSGSNGASMATS